MNKQIVFIVFAVALFMCDRTGHCQEAVRSIPPGEDRITYVREGEKTPYTGQLYDPATALRWANWLLQYRLRLETDTTLQKKVCDADVALEKKRLDIEREKNATVTEDLRQQIMARDVRVMQLQKELDSPPFYKSVWFGTLLGALGAGALFGVGVWAAN